MKADLVIADFTGVYEEEGFLRELQDRGVPYQLVRLDDIEGTNCYCDPEAEVEIARRLGPLSGVGIRWIDSGDYHYVTKILAGFQTEPFDLVLVDNHPDDQEPAFGGVLSCGSWVREMKEGNPMLGTVWTLGPEHRLRNDDGTVDRELEGELEDLLASLEGKRVYLSIDKDVLDRSAARTDWTQGTYGLETLKGWLGRLLEKEVVAIDLCGELTPAKGATPEDLRINCKTNVDLQEFILDCLKK